jgi:hypothetical protein
MKKLFALFVIMLVLLSTPAWAQWFTGLSPFGNNAAPNLNFANAMAAVASMQKLKTDLGGAL